MRLLILGAIAAGLAGAAGGVAAQDAIACPAASAEREGAAGSQTPHQIRLQQARERCEIAAIELAEVQQRNAINAARAAGVPASDYAAGDTTAGTGSGAAEALVLAADQINRRAASIARIAREKAPTADIFVYGGEEFPDLSIYQIYSVRQKALLAQLNAAATQARIVTGDRIETNNFLAPELQIAANVLSYLRSDRSLSGGGLTEVDDAMLVAAVLGAGDAKFKTFQGGSVSRATLAAFESDLRALDEARARLEPAIMACSGEEARLQAELEAAGADATAQQAVRRAHDRRTAACAVVEAGKKAHEDFAAHYVGSGEGAINASDLLEQMNYGRLLKDTDYILLVTVHDSQGGFYTEKNLWSVFGGVPFYITTGTVLSWRLVNNNGEVIAGALEPLYDGYTRMGRVERRLRRPNASAPAQGQAQ